MKKNIKRVLAFILILGMYTIMEPVKYINLANAKAQADASNIYLKSLGIDIGNIDFDENRTYYNVNVDKMENVVKVTAEPKSEDSQVSINGSVVDSSDKYRKEVDLDLGDNVIKIEVLNDNNYLKTYTIIIKRGDYNSNDIYLKNISLSSGNINFDKEKTSYDVTVNDGTDQIKINAEPENINSIVKVDGSKVYDGDDYEQIVNLEKGKNEVVITVDNNRDKKRSYLLNITRGEDLNNNTIQDNIYLSSIKVAGTEIAMSKDKTSYDISVEKDSNVATIQAQPEDDNCMVEYNGNAVDESNNYKRSISLNKDKTQVKIKVEDFNNKKRIYTLNIYKGEIPANDVSVSDKTKTVKTSQWVQVNNKWQYNDGNGNPIKNTWFYDKNYGKNYYLQSDGNMATGWLNNNGKWYYLGSDGAMITGWMFDGGKYYYLYSDGSMASNTTIDGYNLDSSGAWSK